MAHLDGNQYNRKNHRGNEKNLRQVVHFNIQQANLEKEPCSNHYDQN